MIKINLLINFLSHSNLRKFTSITSLNSKIPQKVINEEHLGTHHGNYY